MNDSIEIANYGYNHQLSFTTPETVNSETVLVIDSWNNEISVLLVEGSLPNGVSLEYILERPYKSNVVSYTDLKLRSLPNGVKDTINAVTGEYIQRVGEVVLNGSEDWEQSQPDINANVVCDRFRISVPDLKGGINSSIIAAIARIHINTSTCFKQNITPKTIIHIIVLCIPPL